MDRALEANLLAIKGTLQCSEIAERSGETYLRMEGGKMRGPCPLPGHGGKSPSFYCYANEGNGFFDGWFCHRCDVGGDVVDLHAAIFGPFQTIYMTLHDIAEKWGVKLADEDEMLSGVALVRKKAREAAWRNIERAQTARIFHQSIAPEIMAIEDPKERGETMAVCLRAAGLA